MSVKALSAKAPSATSEHDVPFSFSFSFSSETSFLDGSGIMVELPIPVKKARVRRIIHQISIL
jgi:hypothetical protein